MTTVDRCHLSNDGNHLYQINDEGDHECVYCYKLWHYEIVKKDWS